MPPQTAADCGEAMARVEKFLTTVPGAAGETANVRPASAYRR